MDGWIDDGRENDSGTTREKADMKLNIAVSKCMLGAITRIAGLIISVRLTQVPPSLPLPLLFLVDI